MSWESVLHKLNPAVPNRWLFLIAGVIWTAVGFFLCVRAIGWLKTTASGWLLGGLGAAVAIGWHGLMFKNVARKNAGRISRLPDRVCVFAFTAWRGYGMIALMILLGIALRNSPMPKEYIAPLYIAMGGALVLSSLVFYRSFRNGPSQRLAR